MVDSQAAYCRLCAELKCYQKLVNLDADEHKRLNIMEKLSRLGVYLANIELIDDILPKTVCFVCLELVDKCFSFVSSIEAAQVELTKCVSKRNVKKDVLDENNSPNDRCVVAFGLEKCGGIIEVVKVIKTEVECDSNVPEDSSSIQEDITKCSLEMLEPKTSKHQIEGSEKDLCRVSTKNQDERSMDCNLDLTLSKSNSWNKQTEPVLVKDLLEVTVEAEKEKNIKNSQEILPLSQPSNMSDDDTETISEDMIISKEIQENKDHESPPLSPKLSWKEYRWRCAYCDILFPHVDELKEHAKSMHKCCSAFRCTDCNHKGLQLDKFIMHVKKHRKYLNQSCHKCFRQLLGRYDSIKHKFSHFDTKYRCLHCNDTFKSSEELNTHVATYNKCQRRKGCSTIPEVPTDGLTCLLCHKTYSVMASLRYHLFTHTERKRDHTCDKCGKCFLNRYSLKFHMMLHKDARPYQCDICKNYFRTKAHLSKHVPVHENTKPFGCKQCGRQFRLEAQLSSHIDVHSDTSRPHKCTECDKAFRLKSTLVNHLRQHTGEKPYKCLICDRDFTNVANLNKHLKRYHTVDSNKVVSY